MVCRQPYCKMLNVVTLSHKFLQIHTNCFNRLLKSNLHKHVTHFEGRVYEISSNLCYFTKAKNHKQSLRLFKMCYWPQEKNFCLRNFFYLTFKNHQMLIIKGLRYMCNALAISQNKIAFFHYVHRYTYLYMVDSLRPRLLK